MAKSMRSLAAEEASSSTSPLLRPGGLSSRRSTPPVYGLASPSPTPSLASSIHPVEPLRPVQAHALYLSHILSTWNARCFEFGAILFTAEAFKGTLLMSSLRGLSTTFVTLLVSSAIGTSIDCSKSRLRPLLTSIVINRAAVTLGCLGCYFLLSSASAPGEPEGKTDASSEYAPQRLWMFAVVVTIGIFERLSAVGNVISMERDWVPAVADPVVPVPTPGRADEEENESGEVGLAALEVRSGYTLTHLNAVMRRIDLLCKLFAPLFISGIIEAAGHSFTVGALVLGVMSSLSCGIEVVSALHVWKKNPSLHAPREGRPSASRVGPLESDEDTTADQRKRSRFVFVSVLKSGLVKQYKQLCAYFSSEVWIPSIALTLLHISVLSYSATLITYLLSTGLSLLLITIARAIGSVLEVSSTFAAPVAIRKLSQTRANRRHAHRRRHVQSIGAGDTAHVIGLARSGLWGLSLQFLALVPVVLSLFSLSHSSSSEKPPSITSLITTPLALLSGWASKLVPSHSWTPMLSLAGTPWIVLTIFSFLSLSRVGLWVYDLTATELTQTLVAASSRSSFSGTETAFVALFELAQWVLAAIFSAPADFRWLALASISAVGISLVSVMFWVWHRRGHLVHWDTVCAACEKR